MNPVYENLYNVTDVDESAYEPGGYLEEIDKFDAEFFGISTKEALLMNPLQKLMLETAFLAVEDAGITREQIANTKTGVFVGRDNACISLYNDYVGNIHPLALTGAYASVLSSRISHALKLTGPSMVIDTACSSALVSLHHACKALQDGECVMAIAGGINIKDILLKNDDNPMERIVSDDVKIRTFDKQAKGTLISEGVGAVLLKSLKQAIADGDPIYGVIKGSAVNNDGGANRIATPRAEIQANVLMDAWEAAGIDPESLSYIEAHGIGTYLGDPIEIRALKQAFESYTSKKQFCAISAVKTNIGHTVAASGMASLIKAILSLNHKKIPSLINFEEPNPHISFPDSPVYVNDKLREWEAGEAPRRCGVNSFGFGGTNCHIVLEETPAVQRNGGARATREKWLFALSGRTQEALFELVKKYSSFLKEDSSELADLCYTSCVGRDHYEYRIQLVVESNEDLQEKIRRLQEAEDWKHLNLSGVYYGEHRICKSYKEDSKEEGEVTQAEVDQWTSEANQLVEEGTKEKEVVIDRLCQLYVAGAKIDWQSYYDSTLAKKVRLPGYPLARKSYWYTEEHDHLFRLKKQKRPVAASRTKERNRATTVETENLESQMEKEVKLVGRNDGTYTPTEEQLGLIWGSELAIKEIQVDENYFELGGDSISGIKIVNTMNSKMKLKVS
ncbi:polyketide synthase, partial [Paenibacillus sp. LMG 31461]